MNRQDLRRGALRFAGPLIAIALLLTGCSTSSVRSPAPGSASQRSPKPFSGLVDIGGGRKLYLQCRGSGSPTVVLVSGAGGASDEWTHAAVAGNLADAKPSRSAVFPQVARFTRVCAYDRPGTTLFNGAVSPSTRVSQPTTAQAGVTDLRALLAAAHEPGPYVLAGASWGGMLVNLFARTNSAKVAGLIFVDGASEFLKSTLTSAQWTAWMQAVKTSASSPGGEVPDYASAVDEIRTAPPIPIVPAVVLTADKPWNLPVGDAGPTWPAWLEAQNDLARILDARHVTKTNSSHAIGVEQPRVVTDAIRNVVEKVRNR